MTILFNRSRDRLKRRALRSHMTQAEVMLWSRLRRRALDGYKFRRQHGVGAYVVDFYCPEIKLAVELDGDGHRHAEAQAYDRIRTDFMEGLGIRTIRFMNNDVLRSVDSVLARIRLNIDPTAEFPLLAKEGWPPKADGVVK